MNEACATGHVGTGWPEGKQFAFTIFDDPDAQSVEGGKRVYGFLADLGFRTTRGVWPGAAVRTPNSGGAACDDIEYRRHTQELQRAGLEVGYHNHTKHSSTREEILAGLDAFRDYFGHDPVAMANHYNADAIYWGPARLTPPIRSVYVAATAGRTNRRHFGHVPGHSCFWGDACRERIRYCRNFVYRNINTLAACPWMPYHDPSKPFVNAWYASTEGSNAGRFLNALSEANQDRLATEGGACIMYTHFGHGFVENGALAPRFCDLMRRLSRMDGWFVPVSVLLDYLSRRRNGPVQIAPGERRNLEWRWLGEKLFRGTS
jgi:hypothetical protein